MHKSSAICIIPARGGSKGIPGKNIKNFEGKPLISHSIEYAKDSKLVNEIYVSTDDQQIAHISKTAGAKIMSILLNLLLIFSTKDEQIVSAALGLLNSFAHCMYCLLCKPEESIKWPSSNALVSFKIFKDSS